MHQLNWHVSNDVDIPEESLVGLVALASQIAV